MIKCPRADGILNPETMKFVECIAYLNESPTAIKLRKSITPSNSEEIRVYDVIDVDNRDYRALVINKKAPAGNNVPSFYYGKRSLVGIAFRSVIADPSSQPTGTLTSACNWARRKQYNSTKCDIRTTSQAWWISRIDRTPRSLLSLCAQELLNI